MEWKRRLRDQRRVDGCQLVPIRNLKFDCFLATLAHDHLVRGVRGRQWMLWQDATEVTAEFFADEDGNQADVGFPGPRAADPSQSMASRTRLSVVHRPKPI